MLRHIVHISRAPAFAKCSKIWTSEFRFQEWKRFGILLEIFEVSLCLQRSIRLVLGIMGTSQEPKFMTMKDKPKTRKPSFSEFDISGRVHDSQNRLFFISGDTRIPQIIQETIPIRFWENIRLENLKNLEFVFSWNIWKRAGARKSRRSV